MPRARQIKITKDDQEGFVLRESVAAWERNGWTVADDESSEEEAAEVTDRPMESITAPDAQDPIEGDEGQLPPAESDAPVAEQKTTAAKKTTARKAP